MSRAARIEEAARELARYARSYGQYHLDKFYDGEIGVNAGVRRLWDCADAVDAALALPADAGLLARPVDRAEIVEIVAQALATRLSEWVRTDALAETVADAILREVGR